VTSTASFGAHHGEAKLEVSDVVLAKDSTILSGNRKAEKRGGVDWSPPSQGMRRLDRHGHITKRFLEIREEKSRTTFTITRPCFRRAPGKGMGWSHVSPDGREEIKSHLLRPSVLLSRTDRGVVRRREEAESLRSDSKDPPSNAGTAAEPKEKESERRLSVGAAKI